MNDTIYCPDNKTTCEVHYTWMDDGFCQEYLQQDCLQYPCNLTGCFKVPVMMPGYCKNETCYVMPDPIPPGKLNIYFINLCVTIFTT